MSIEATNQVMIFGKQLQPTEDGYELSPGGLQRLDRFIEFYRADPTPFASRDAIVVCSGGYAGLASGEAERNIDQSEATFMADYLLGQGIPSGLIETEDTSNSTVRNMVNTFGPESDLIDPSAFSPEYRLGLVSHPNHLKRILMFAGKLGIDHASTELIPTRVSDSTLVEFGIRNFLYRPLLLGAEGPEQLAARDEFLGKVLSTVRGGKKPSAEAA
ncbi:YdcF family protein [Candidatus Saccharibacteria bacterium]|nr:YdcF family protein [Candidatus Saccharibacteria bacterium]